MGRENWWPPTWWVLMPPDVVDSSGTKVTVYSSHVVGNV
jgi:hypothetical protein